MLFSEEALKELSELFPNIEQEVIKSVLEANRGSKEASANALVEMS